VRLKMRRRFASRRAKARSRLAAAGPPAAPHGRLARRRTALNEDVDALCSCSGALHTALDWRGVEARRRKSVVRPLPPPVRMGRPASSHPAAAPPPLVGVHEEEVPPSRTMILGGWARPIRGRGGDERASRPWLSMVAGGCTLPAGIKEAGRDIPNGWDWKRKVRW